MPPVVAVSETSSTPYAPAAYQPLSVTVMVSAVAPVVNVRVSSVQPVEFVQVEVETPLPAAARVTYGPRTQALSV
ncbi:hypothetical protein GCM10025734_61110 [Kitasatospora paranensis]